MSTNTVLGFIAGVVVGALAALMLAPKSGEELRAELTQQAQQEKSRLAQQYEQRVSELQDRLEKARGDIATPAPG